ncbi:hypothetical protein SMC26_39510 [Actinomadura fulvescens]|uniref:PD-(D/E)XK endonuclease-like domain-containing protein n=1 Tax=Actinomadura fulvescens TaxID=46160 RepID=A0ABP6C9W4_9ACTN
MGKVNTIQRGGSRFYVEPESGEKAPGVTSIVGMLPKPFLTFWAAKMTAEAAVDNIDAVAALAKSDPDAAVDMLKGAHRRYTKSRADIGSAAHDMFERMIRGENVRRVGMDLEPYRRHFAEFLDRVQPEPLSLEDVMWSDTHNYAGSSDAILKIGDDVVIVDWKTSKDTYPDVALQLSAYAYADRIIDADGASRPMPKIDAGAVLHVTAERWALKPVDVRPHVFDMFLHLRAVFTWDRETSKTVIGKPVESGGALVTGTERRAR